MVEAKKSTVVTVRLSQRDLKRVETLCRLEKVDCSTLVKKLIEDGLRNRVLRFYNNGKLSAGRGAEILDISLREFLELLERERLPIKWDVERLKDSKWGKDAFPDAGEATFGN